MRLDNSIKRSFPRLSDWIKENIPRYRHNPRVFDAFVKYSQLSEPDASAALKYIGSQPTIDIRVTRSYGVWLSKYPDKVFISRRLCRQWERQDPDQKAGTNWDLIMSATILHAMIHWADYKADKIHQPDRDIWDDVKQKWLHDRDVGFQFENDAFNGIYTKEWL